MPKQLSMKIHKPTLFIGISLMFFSLFMPSFLTIDTFHITEDLVISIRTSQPVLLINVALQLVTLNVLRSLGHYCGAFLIAESIVITDNNRWKMLIKALIVCVIIPPVYFMVEQFYHIHYDFGVPALALLCLLTLISQANYNLVSIIKKVLMVTSFIAAMQFLDVMPTLNNLPFGRGETSREVKMIAAFFEIEDTLNFFALVFFLLFFFVGVLLFFLIRDENKLRLISELKEQNERMIMESRMRALENRTTMELRHLVHDLKSPLASAQVLVGVLKVSAQAVQANNKTLEYFEHIENSIDRMSNMISEILYENHFSLLPTKEIISSVLSQISISQYSSLVQVLNNIPEQLLHVNKIRIVRALVNLIENSFYAVDPEKGKIVVALDEHQIDQQQFVKISVSDNGKGMTEEEIDSAWISGYSTRDSHGLGLAFVKQVITNSGGTVSIQSTVNTGTTVVLILPKGELSNVS
ncbi:MAG: putative two-component histidine kinase [Oscillospiraceae bacterium]|jgi:signal transduction histidine kinase|nr:putative two-component histidine kinase [Oscillospiraceae bacterium]